MLCLIDIYNDILNDFTKPVYCDSEVLFRKFKLNKGNMILLTVHKSTKRAEVSFLLEKYSANAIKELPKWKGMEERVLSGIDGEQDKPFLTFSQAEDYDEKIYFAVMQDLINNIVNQDSTGLLLIIKRTLERWKVFFQFEKEYLLSENVQQGLFGELYILNKVISIYGDKAIESWTGCNAETHDFYFGKDALEVKSSSAKGPDRVRISSEYQMDGSKIEGALYMMYLKIKKSEIYGQTLSQLVESISKKLNDAMKCIFYDKLLKVGYVYQMPEWYNIHFTVQEERCYQIEDSFPKITREDIPKGISTVSYMLSLDVCEKYEITVENYYRRIEI